MKPRTCLIYIFGWLLAAACFTPRLAAAQLRVYIVTDLEGASGVNQFAQTREPGAPLAEKAKEYLMGDIAAVVRGLRDAHVTDILVLDGHGSQACVPHLMALRRAVAAIPRRQPYKLSLPIQAKKQYLVFDGPAGQSRLATKEGKIEEVLKLLDF